MKTILKYRFAYLLLLAVTLLSYAIISYSPSIGIYFSYAQRMYIVNSESNSVVQDQWQIRLPFGVEEFSGDSLKQMTNYSGGWIDLEPITLPPYSKHTKVLTIKGIQYYPELPNMLLEGYDFESLRKSNLTSLDNISDLESLLDWVHSKLTYGGFNSHPLNLSELLNKGEGDCTEFTVLAYHKLIASGYENVIPVEGYYLPDNESKVVRSGNGHAWLLVKLDGVWWVIDPLYKKIQLPSSEYVVMNILVEGNLQQVIKNSKLPLSF